MPHNGTGVKSSLWSVDNHGLLLPFANLVRRYFFFQVHLLYVPLNYRGWGKKTVNFSTHSTSKPFIFKFSFISVLAQDLTIPQGAKGIDISVMLNCPFQVCFLFNFIFLILYLLCPFLEFVWRWRALDRQLALERCTRRACHDVYIYPLPPSTGHFGSRVRRKGRGVSCRAACQLVRDQVCVSVCRRSPFGVLFDDATWFD